MSTTITLSDASGLGTTIHEALLSPLSLRSWARQGEPEPELSPVSIADLLVEQEGLALTATTTLPCAPVDPDLIRIDLADGDGAQHELLVRVATLSEDGARLSGEIVAVDGVPREEWLRSRGYAAEQAGGAR